MKFRFATVAVAIGATLAGSVILAAPAQAATKTCQVDQWRYDICFDGANDAFYVSDMYADGHRAVVEWIAMDGSGRKGECHDSNGAHNGWTVCDYDFREGTNKYVIFQGMTRNGANGKSAYFSWMYTGYITPR
ncbi:hypothetical protein ACIBCM_27170 [Streptomyces sp. NPDC051018]|uniref:hypothetical protein n=1 Tax=Streptomyces sp. NPDC051018 TaxID=3365639 RepID=UPI0037BDE983